MTHRTIAVSLSALMLCLAAPAVRADNLETVEKKIAEALAKHKSLRIKSKAKTNHQMQGMTIQSDIESLAEHQRNGEKDYRSRTEIESTSVRKMEGLDEVKEKMTMLQVYDGEYWYTLTTAGGQKTAMKTKVTAGHISPFDAVASFKMQHDMAKVKLLPEESIDGKGMYVIETTTGRKDGDAPETYSRTVTHYDKKTGIVMKVASYDKAGKEVMSSVTTEVKIDPGISDERFVFKAPPDVEVVDMTQMHQQALESERSAESESDTDSEADEAEDADSGTDRAKTDESNEEEKPAKEEKKEKKPSDAVKGLFKGLR